MSVLKSLFFVIIFFVVTFDFILELFKSCKNNVHTSNNKSNLIDLLFDVYDRTRRIRYLVKVSQCAYSFYEFYEFRNIIWKFYLQLFIHIYFLTLTVCFVRTPCLVYLVVAMQLPQLSIRKVVK